MMRFTSGVSALELHYRFSSIVECFQVKFLGLCKPVVHCVFAYDGLWSGMRLHTRMTVVAVFLKYTGTWGTASDRPTPSVQLALI